MSISSEIARISENISGAFDAIEAKGVTVPSGANSDNLATLISQIQSGNYVTPEQYGAVGDGTTDDSQAVQDACDAGYAVYFASNKTYYLASTITIDHDCHLFGGEGATIKTKTPTGGVAPNAIVVTGTLKRTTTLTTDYSSTGSTANSGNQFTLSNMTDISIGDILIVEATDQYYSYARDYYYLGGVLLVSDIYDGHIYTSNSFPFDIENTANVSVKIYSAPIAIIENLNFISDLDSMGNYINCITLDKCKNSIVRNCGLTQMDNGVAVKYCINTLLDCVIVSKSKYDNSLTGDGYGILIYSSSETLVQRVLAICAQGCVALSGQVPCINTFVRNCNLTSECRSIGIDMHENSYNIVVEDCTLGGLSLYGTAYVNRCRFIKNNRSGSTAKTAIVFRGSHDPRWATLHVEDCVFDDETIVSIERPTPQNPIQAFANIVGSIEITNCDGGLLCYNPDTSSSVTSNSINRIIINNWRNCKEIYHTSGNVIKYLQIKDSTFTNECSINNHNSYYYLDYIEHLDYSDLQTQSCKYHLDRVTYGERCVLPQDVSIVLSSSNPSAQYRVCGANLAPNVADDYYVGIIGGSEGAALTRSQQTGSGVATVTINNNGNVVYTQKSNTSQYMFYPVGMFYVSERSAVSISATMKNTGTTDGAAFYPYIAIVNCDTGLLTYRGNGSKVTATSAGASISHSYTANANSVVLCYFYCSNPVSGAVTTFEDLSITSTPLFCSPVINEPYNAKRLTGDGTITSFSGVNNIMCSDTTFNVKINADLASNPIGLPPSASGVSF